MTRDELLTRAAKRVVRIRQGKLGNTELFIIRNNEVDSCFSNTLVMAKEFARHYREQNFITLLHAVKTLERHGLQVKLSDKHKRQEKNP